MIYILLNIVPILVAAVAATAVGAVWYRQTHAGVLLTLFAAQAWLAAILNGALILAPPKAGVWTMTLGSAFIIWVGFVLPAIAATYRLRGLAWRTVAFDVAYWFVAMLGQAALMRVIGVVPPPA